MQKLIGLLLYMSMFRLPQLSDYWRIMSLFHGAWARTFIPSRDRFRALMTFLHVSLPSEEDQDDQLRKLRWLDTHMKQQCKKYLQPGQFVSVDDRMIKMKGRSILRQYMPNKPIKWGIKLFALADVTTSYRYLVDFDVYCGAVHGQTEVGLTHAGGCELDRKLPASRIHCLYQQFLHISTTSNVTASKWVPSCWYSFESTGRIFHDH